MQFKNLITKKGTTLLCRRMISVCLAIIMTVAVLPVMSLTVNAVEPTALESVTFGYAYDVQRYPAYPKAGDNVELSWLDEPFLSNGVSGTTSEGNWTLTKIGTYSYLENSGRGSTSLKYIVDEVADKYTDLSSDKIVLHELKDGNTHIAYGVVVAYNSTDGLAVFIGDSLSSSAGYLLSKISRSGTVYTTATAVITDWTPPQTYDITIASSENGTTKTSVTKAVENDTITITAAPDEGYKVDTVKYNDGVDHVVSLTGDKYTFTMPAKAVTVTVTYAVKTYTVTYRADGKEVGSPQTVEHGKDATAPQIPAKAGYTGKWDSDGKNIKNDTTINAVYTKITTTNTPSVDTDTSTTPQTSDNNNLTFMCVLLLVNGCLLLGVTVYNNKKKTKMN